MPEFQEDNRLAELYHLNHQRKGHQQLETVSYFFNKNETERYLLFENQTTKFVYKATDNPHIYLIYLEYVCIFWFTLEYILRLNYGF